MSDIDVLERSEVKTHEKVNEVAGVDPPQLYSVIYLNDETTSSDFVIQSLMNVFNYQIEEAVTLTSIIDTNGFGVVLSGISQELANHLRTLVIEMATTAGYPLQVEVRPDTK